MKRVAILTILLCLLLALPVAAANFREQDSLIVGDGFSFRAPEGWELSKVADNYSLLPPTFPDTGSVIGFSLSDKSADFNTAYTQSYFESIYGWAYDDLEIQAFTRETVAGAPAYRIACSFELAGWDIRQTQYILDLPDATMSLTFTEMDIPLAEHMALIIDSLQIDGLEGEGDRSTGTESLGTFESRLVQKLRGRMDKIALQG